MSRDALLPDQRIWSVGECIKVFMKWLVHYTPYTIQDDLLVGVLFGDKIAIGG